MTTGEPNPYRTRRPRRGPRALLPLAIAAWAVLEIWLLLLIGDAAGGWTVFLLLVAAFVIGAVIIKQAGRRAWQRLSEAVSTGGAPPEDDRASRGGNGLAMLGGLLLMVPGLISDAVGLLCVFPPTAALLRRAGMRHVRRSAGPVGAAFEEARAARDRARMRRPDGRVVRGEVIREDDEDDEKGPGRTDPEDRGDRDRGGGELGGPR
ncbi:FxsA family membrane protein [Streptomyces sp. SBT349]|uniref:FxsA family membrane protein n=1 Tax=Streptomyces sp. SBT349 TaxID=1580539 RepID=UPI00066A8CEE|nr:FxsA family membrane protein [Streptomyces sp. SBT349]